MQRGLIAGKSRLVKQNGHIYRMFPEAAGATEKYFFLSTNIC